MALPLVLAWLAAAIALLVQAVSWLEEARRDPGAPVPRGRVLATAVVLAVLAASATWVWSGALARRGDQQLRARAGEARVELRSLTLAVAGTSTVGFSAAADLELPTSWTLAEAERAGDLLWISLDGAVTTVAPALAADSTTRIALRVDDDPTPDPIALARRADCAHPSRDPVAIDRPGTVVALLCRGDRAIAALVFARIADADAVRVWPLIRRGGALAPHSVELAAGAALQLGAPSGAVPGLTSWALPAPRGHVDVLVAPDDVRAPCATWAAGIGAATATARGEHACTLRLASVYELEIRRRTPDVAGLQDRAGWAAAVLVLPAILALLALATRPRGAIDRSRLARLAALGWLAVVLAAVASWRLTWAHRIDMLRDLEPSGPRTLLAQLVVVATASALTGLVTAATLRGRVRLPATLLATLAWMALAGLVLLGDLAAVAQLRGLPILLASSLLIALIAALTPLPNRFRALVSGDGFRTLVLIGLAVIALGAAAMAPRLVAVKLGLAWLVPLVGYDLLRGTIARDVGWGSVAVALGAITAALGALFRLDAGVTIAIAAPGVVIAVVVVTHDLLYHPRDARLIDRWERHQLPLTLGHAAVLGGAGALALAACLVDAITRGAADATLPARLTGAALHAPAVIAVALVASALVARRRDALRAALIPAAVAAIAALVWMQRGPLVAHAIGSDDASGKRLAAVVAPGYALLRDERSLVAALTAWRETGVTGSTFDGEGYFAATIADPGVTVSIENDYLAVLVVRETGIAGAASTAALLLTAIAGAWWLGAASRRPGAAGTRRRSVGALALAAVTVYQPLAALGVLPLTGVSWPGLGIDSPSDALLHLVVLAWLAAPAAGRADAHELAVRTAPRWRRARVATALATALAALAGVAVVARAAAFAAGRGTDAPLADGVDRAAAYAATLACPLPPASSPDGAIPADLIGIPLDAATARYHAELRARWRGARADAVAATGELRAGARCEGHRGAWRLAPAGVAGCALTLDAGWPTLTLTVAPAGTAPAVRCAVSVDRDVLTPLRRTGPPPLPRIRLVGAPVPADRAELVSDHLIVRMRAGAGEVDLTLVDAGLHPAARAILAPGVSVTVATTGVLIDATPGAARLLISGPSPAGPRWRRPACEGTAAECALHVEIAGIAVLLVDTGPRQRAWLVRGPDTPGGTVAPLLADDLGTAAAARRHYVYGGALPELGWVNPYDVRRSLGLDGWVHAALARPAPAAAASCGTLAPSPSPSPCAPSPHDGVLECQVSLQPDLALRLRHLVKLVALDPASFAGKGAPATRAAFVLLRGDTGELLAEGDFVPGRAAPAYAPGTPAVERALIRLREDRDPLTGAPLPAGARGEASAEKADLHRPIAVGSTLKPLIARAAEQVAPMWTAQLQLRFDPEAPARCRRGIHGVLGHCPPRELLDRHGDGWVGFHDYLATSSNAFQAVLGLVALGWPDGTYRDGDLDLDLGDLLAADVTDWSAPISISNRDRRVVGARSVRLEPLRATPFWRRLEALIGRPMCTLGSAEACARAADRRDLCAVRALPIAAPTADLRHLVALGPSTFDLYPAGSRDAAAVPVGEYFQLLRGSGVHALGSLAQLTDAFNRLIYDRATDGAYRLAASWFPVPPAGQLPREACTRDGGHAGLVLGDDGGLCGVVRPGGTAARAMDALLDDPRIVLYGAKTGTIDGLGDVAERRRSCDAWNRAHTIADRPARAADQPYWLRCGAAVEDDSLFVVSFGVRVGDQIVPLTLGLHLERTGKGVAAHLARHHVLAIADQLAGRP